MDQYYVKHNKSNHYLPAGLGWKKNQLCAAETVELSPCFVIM